ncbi:UNVERIFIED_CONTAM: DNA-binding MarR family transcriptional regulator [Paenibacillus sp. PvR008]
MNHPLHDSHGNKAVELIEYELTTFIRRAVYIDQSEHKIGTLERATYLLLRQLMEYGPTRVKTLADMFLLDISTVSRQTAALETKGLIRRLSDPSDGRVSLFEISELGKKLLLKDKKMRVARYCEMLESWTNEEQEKFGELLVRLNKTYIEG